MKSSIKDFGENKIDIPVPKFIDLLKEQASAPFFVFQIFCVVLWSLDEYWYYSLFTLVMLVMFESMLALQRLKNLQMIRQMSREPRTIYVYRSKRWTGIMSNELLPNDLVSVDK